MHDYIDTLRRDKIRRDSLLPEAKGPASSHFRAVDDLEATLQLGRVTVLNNTGRENHGGKKSKVLVVGKTIGQLSCWASTELVLEQPQGSL